MSTFGCRGLLTHRRPQPCCCWPSYQTGSVYSPPGRLWCRWRRGPPAEESWWFPSQRPPPRGPSSAVPGTGNKDLQTCRQQSSRLRGERLKTLRLVCSAWILKTGTDLWNCWNRFMGMKVSRLYWVVQMALPWYFLGRAAYCCWRGPWRANTVLLFPPGPWEELLLAEPSGAEYQPRLESADSSCRQRCCTQWKLSICRMAQAASALRPPLVPLNSPVVHDGWSQPTHPSYFQHRERRVLVLSITVKSDDSPHLPTQEPPEFIWTCRRVW